MTIIRLRRFTAALVLLTGGALGAGTIDIGGEFKSAGGKDMPGGWKQNSTTVGQGTIGRAADGALVMSLARGKSLAVYSARFPVKSKRVYTIRLESVGDSKPTAGFYLYDKDDKWLKRVSDSSPVSKSETHPVSGKNEISEFNYTIPEVPAGEPQAAWGRVYISADDLPATIRRASLTEGNEISSADHGAKLRRQPGEIMPRLMYPNLIGNNDFNDGLRHWTVLSGNCKVAEIDGSPALRLDTRDGKSAVVVSEPIAVVPGKRYLLTYVCHTGEAKFGTFGEAAICEEIEDANILQSFFRPRIWGFVGGREILNRGTGEWFRRTIEYTAPENCRTVKLAIGQYGTGAGIYYDSFYFGELGADTRGDGHLRYTEALDPKLPEREVTARLLARPDATAENLKDGTGRLKLDGKIFPPLIYFADPCRPERSKGVDFMQAGVQLHIVSLMQLTQTIWRGDNDYDLAKVDSLIQAAVSRNPDGYYLVRLDLTPFADWHVRHPGDTALGPDGKILQDRHGRKGPPCHWSEYYRASSEKFINDLISHMRKQPYFRSIAGFFISGNDDGQFYYPKNGSKTLQQGMSEAAQVTFRQWLRRKYKSDRELQQAWHNPEVTLDNARTTVATTRYPGNFFNPATQQHEIDVISFFNESMAEFANRMCEAARKAAGKPVVTAMWWSRGGELGVYPLLAESKTTLPSNALDLMGAQGGYWGERENANTSIMPWIFDSTRLHGKIPIYEADLRTWISQNKSLRMDFHCTRSWTEYDLRNVMLREFGKSFAVGGGMWWYDMGGGWYNTPEIMKIVKDIAMAAKPLTDTPAKFTPADIVFISDEPNYFATTEQINIWNGPNYQTVRSNQRAMMRSGVKYDCYYLNDIVERNMTGYKVYVFMNIFNLSAQDRNFINEKLKRGGKTIVWLYAPGYVGSDGFSDKRISELTGINIEVAGVNTGLARFLPGNDPLANGLAGKQVGIGLNMPGERFAVADKQATALASYDLDGRIAAAVRQFPEWRSIYLAIPSGFTPQLLQNIVRTAGGHIYNTVPGDLFVHHRDDLICLHGIEGNANIIALPYEAEVKDLLSGIPVEVKDRKFTVKLQPGETRLLQVTKKPKSL